MKQEDRQQQILELIQQEKCSNVKELCAAVFASDATVRRDLHTLERKGYIRLIYGNILLLDRKGSEMPLAIRANEAKDAKRLIARCAAGMIRPNSSVLLDSSSSALYMADYIHTEHNITVFTNCIKTALKLYERGITVYQIGGLIANDSLLTNSAWTIDTISSLHVDYLFFSAQSLSNSGCIGGVSEQGVQIRKCMIRHATRQYFLCNAEKLGLTSTFTLCNANEITGVICNADISFLPGVNYIPVDC